MPPPLLVLVTFGLRDILFLCHFIYLYLKTALLQPAADFEPISSLETGHNTVLPPPTYAGN